jgi:crossover junction endodeoxyribonuclease RuvC
MIVMGVDPGSVVTGYGLIEKKQDDTLDVVNSGCVRTSAKDDFYFRLKKIYDEISKCIDEYCPAHVVFEDVFYSRNVKVALQLGQARGAALLAAVNHERKIYTYSAREVKQALTGYGNASKEQVQAMVTRLLRLQQKLSPLDISDALAIAICHLHRYKHTDY